MSNTLRKMEAPISMTPDLPGKNLRPLPGASRDYTARRLTLTGSCAAQMQRASRVALRSKFVLVIDLTTAKALGLTIPPPSYLLSAD